jgi:transposase
MGRPKKAIAACHLAEVKRTYKGTTYTTTLLRRTYREDGKVKHETLGNLSHLPPAALSLVKRSLAGEQFVSSDGLHIERTLPHGHVAATLGMLKKLGLHQLIDSQPSRERDMVCSMIVSRVLEARSKLATARLLAEQTRSSSLSEVLGLQDIDEDDLYRAMDWLLERQPRIEKALSDRHLKGAMLTLYDVSSTYFEGRHCPLAKLGHSRDHRRDRPQIVFGLVCDEQGRPVAVEVFEGNTGDPRTVGAQVKKLCERFGLERVVMVGDRGMLTSARIEQDLAPDEVDWISALRAPQIRRLAEEGALQLSLFDKRDLAEIKSADFPNERLVACRNPLLLEERRRKRNEMLAATEKKLELIRDAVHRTKRPLRGKDKIGLRVGLAMARTKMGKHFEVEFTDDSFHFERKQANIEQEAALDGIYVVRTSLPKRDIDAESVVRAYKQLANVERAFRCIKTTDLKIRPVFHYTADRVRSHIFLCMLAYYVEWHMREALAPMLFGEDDRDAAELGRASAVAPATASSGTVAKARSKHTADGEPAHSFRTLLLDLATIAHNRVRTDTADESPTFTVITTPTPLQQRALSLLGVGLSL